MIMSKMLVVRERSVVAEYSSSSSNASVKSVSNTFMQCTCGNKGDAHIQEASADNKVSIVKYFETYC